MALLSKRRKRFIAGLFTATAVGIVICLVSNFNLFHVIQLQSSDFLFKAANLNPATDPDKNIVIVAIDDKSLEQLGRFPSWPRSYHANLINVIAEAEARVIVFDIL